MLYEFVATYHDAIIARAREKVSHRPWPPASVSELEHGLPRFLIQLSETLRSETTETPMSSDAMNASATIHGRELLALGFSVSQVVHDYGDICQAVTELAVGLHAPITTEEFHTLNRCLDTAIAEAVTEHARITAQSRSNQEVERVGQLSHEMRVDPHVLSSAVMNLLSNAFKFTRPGGRVILRAHHEDGRARIEVEDECGGIADKKSDPFRPFTEQRGTDRTGLGLGLSIARKAAKAQGGDISIRNMPGKGCVFVIEIPLAACEPMVPHAPV